MKKINKVVLSVALIFSLFMICGEVKADPLEVCTRENTSVVLSKLNQEERETIGSIVDAETSNLNEGLDEYYDAYYVGFASTYNCRMTENSDFNVVMEGPYNGIIRYIPLTSVGGEVRSFEKDSKYYINHRLGGDLSTIEGETANTGILVVEHYFNSEENDLSLRANAEYDSWQGMDLTMNGIVASNSSTDAEVSVDVFFGDFRFNYALYKDYGSDYSGTVYGRWEPVNNNSGTLIVDNTKSLTDLHCQLQWDSSEAQVGLSVGTDYFENEEIGRGDTGPTILGETPETRSSETYLARFGGKIKFDIKPDGGTMAHAREILNNGGKIGSLSLYISTEEN